MRKTFEEIAADIVLKYMDNKINEAGQTQSGWQVQHDYEFGDLNMLANTIATLANRLANNYRERAVTWDSENFDREVENMLDVGSN